MAPMASGKALCKYFNTKTYSEDGLNSAQLYGPTGTFCVCDDETPGSAKRRNSLSSRIPQHVITIYAWKFNPLNTKRRPLYLKTQFVPRSKHFSSRL